MDEHASSVTAIILAAGESTRMGDENKLLLPFNGKPVIEHVVDAVVSSNVGPVYVVVGHQQELVRPVIQHYPVTLVENPIYVEGMGTSIRAGVEHAGEEASGFMICLSDLPRITSDEYAYLVQSFLAHHSKDKNTITVPYFEGQRGNPVILSSVYRPAMLAQQGVVGCRGLIKQHPEHVRNVEMPTAHVVADVDTPEAYQQLIGR